MRSSWRDALAACALAATLLSACGTAVPTSTSPSAAVTARPAASIVRSISVRTTDGRMLSIPDGQRPTLVYFMAAWCVSCVQGARNIAQLHNDYASRGLRILAIDVEQGETSDDLARFRGLAGDPPYDWALDEGGRVTQALAIRTLDATLLIGPKGEVLFRSESLPNPNTLRRAVQLALGS